MVSDLLRSAGGGSMSNEGSKCSAPMRWPAAGLAEGGYPNARGLPTADFTALIGATERPNKWLSLRQRLSLAYPLWHSPHTKQVLFQKGLLHGLQGAGLLVVPSVHTGGLC